MKLTDIELRFAPDDYPLSKVIRDFWANVKKTDTCWLWTGSVQGDAYGKIVVCGKTISVHRFSKLLDLGEIADDLYVCHQCDVKLCVRPDHLFLGTAKDNMADAVNKGRMRRGERSPMSKLTDDKVRAIRQEYEAGATQAELAAKFNMHQTNISRVIHGKTWKHVK